MEKATVRQKKKTNKSLVKNLLKAKKATSPAVVALSLVLVTLVAGFFSTTW